jgi:hypothetical protein
VHLAHVTGTGKEKGGGLGPAGSGAWLFPQAKCIIKVFYLLGSDILCLTKRVISTGTGTLHNDRFLFSRFRCCFFL